MQSGSKKDNFNLKIARYFLENSRLTVLCFLLLVGLAIVSTVFLKTTGFPNPDINFAVISTEYIGASSESVAKDVTIAVEGAIKDIEGISSYTSTSMNSVSVVELTIDESYDNDKVVSEINSALDNADLPKDASKPKVIVPEIAGPDFQFSLIGENNFELYEAYEQIKNDLSELPETSKVTSQNGINRQVLIRPNYERMTDFDITEADIVQKLNSLNQSFPVANKVQIDNKTTGIVTTFEGDDLNTLKSLPFGEHKLKDFAIVSLTYEYDSGLETTIAFKGITRKALSFEVYTSENSDLNKYNEKIEEIFQDYENVNFLSNEEVTNNEFSDENVDWNKNGKPTLVENFSSHEQTKLQVQEVMSGLVGGKLSRDGTFRNLGYLLGGIQLVFFVMIIFVSFRAALVAALAIPMSLVFSNIYVFLTGNTLNTLVLFSLVLVIGLVVDPALVILESVQRKKDIGLGKDAALEAVKDVGSGLFLATLTNIIVFFPFAIVSGLLGEIIKYIPMTVMPAIVGSYIVPLIFLAWIGSFFLKRRKNSTDNEEENLWGAAKALKAVNLWLVSSPIFLRIVLLSIAFVAPLIVTGMLFMGGHIKSVDFSGSQNADYLMASGTFFPNSSDDEKELLKRLILSEIAKDEDVIQAFPYQWGELSYLIILKPASERETLSIDLAEKINDKVQEKYGDSFFDLSIGTMSEGPPTAVYQVALSLSSDDMEALKGASLEIGNVLKSTCLKDNKITLNGKCEGGDRIVTKVDDGYSQQENPILEVIIDRKKLEDKQLVVPDAPLSALVYAKLSEVFGTKNDPVSSVNINGSETDIVISQNNANAKSDSKPKTATELKNLEIINLRGEIVKLKDVATIKETNAKSAIKRVNGETVSVVQARLVADHSDQVTAKMVSDAVIEYFTENDSARLSKYSLPDDSLKVYTQGDLASFTKSFKELSAALVIAIFLTYLVLVVFFESFSQPLVILFTIPLTFIGVFPALALWGGGQFGFLEIIGLIILVGLVENVAIFLIDLAKQKIAEGMDEKEAIAYASAIRLRPVILTTLTAVASLAPLAVTSDQYRSMAIVIMFGLLSSGITSLFTTPMLFILFRSISKKLHRKSRSTIS